MPNKITKIILENYRAFYDITTIDIGGKNVLIYGENGSGKSSLYEGLKRCFESCTLPSVYFSTHLLAPPSSAKISLLFENETLPYKFDDTVPVSSLPFKVPISKAYKNSGFLSYRELLRTHLMSNLYDEEVFETEFAELLITQILAYQEIKRPYTYFSLWERLNQPKVDRKIKISLLRDFDTLCTQKLIDIAVLANRILAYFDKDLVIALNLRLPSTLEYRVPKNKQSKQNIPVAKIALNVHLNGVLMSNADELHLTLLNEARLSALAISIYFASLLLDSQYEDYRILFLDDIFIGLDMSNRLPLLEILKTEFSGWQIFMTTYDRHWFEVAKTEFGTSNWLPIEMYVGEEDIAGVRIQKPVIISPSLSYFEKAELYFKAKDYPAAANYLRKELEKIIKERLAIEQKSDFEGKPHSLSHLWEILSNRYQNLKEPIDSKISDALKHSRMVFLNPQSHDALTYPIYEAEIKRTFDVINAIKKLPIIQNIIVLHSGAKLVFKHPTINYSFHFTLTSDWRMDFNKNTLSVSCPKCKVEIFQYENTDFGNPTTGRKYEESIINNIKNKQDKIDDIFNNLKKIAILSITDEMLYENIVIDNAWKLIDIFMYVIDLSTKRIL